MTNLTKLCSALRIGSYLVTLAAGVAFAQPENTGTNQQPLVTPNPPVDQQTQLQFGLLTLSNPEGTCSASMLNDYWAITAAHCVFSFNGPCPQFQPSQITLQANWPPSGGPPKPSPTVLQIIVFGTPSRCPNTVGLPNDVALLQVGPHQLDRVDSKPMKLHDLRPMNNLTLTAYGRGINALAFQAGPTAVPTQTDGQFRWADFSIINISPDSSLPPSNYTFPGNRGATIAGGDSGGPSYIQEWDNPLSPQRKLEWRLMGVHSFCSYGCLPGKTCLLPSPWTWVASISQCSDAAILPIRAALLADIEAVPPDNSPSGTFPTTTPDSVLRARRALYAISTDEPLIGPPAAAIDVQLTFERCHLRAVRTGCPVAPDFEQWAYDPATHRLYHADSGKCVNISGARHDAGSPIILYPCSGAPNEKWTLLEHAGSPVWSIKSDLTGMCLTARTPSVPPGRFRLEPATTLVQMPCNGSDAQRFSNTDSDWARRNGPH